MNFEISREDLLKLKHSSYEMYQFVISQKSADGDYCETLDKEKLAKECELGYFKIEDLFTKKQIIEAFHNITREKNKKLYESTKPATAYVKLENVIPDKEIPGAYHIKKEPPKKHQALLDFIEKNPLERIEILYSEMNKNNVSELLLSIGFTWRNNYNKDWLDNNLKLFINYFGIMREIKVLSFGGDSSNYKYCLKTEKFI